MCRALGVSRSWYYAWRKNPMSRREKENEGFVEEIQEIHEKSRKTYGSPRVHAELNEKGYLIGHNRVARLMKKNNIRAKAKKKFKGTTHSKHKHPVAKNLLKDIQVRKHSQLGYISPYQFESQKELEKVA